MDKNAIIKTVLLFIVTMVINSYCQTAIRSLPCRDTVIESKRWILDSIGASQLYDSLHGVQAYLNKPIWIEFSNQKQFYGSDGCNGIFGNYVAYDGHIFFYDAGSQAGLCKYGKHESAIRKLQDYFRQSLAITRYSCSDSNLVVRTVYGNLIFKKQARNIGYNEEAPNAKDLKDMYNDLNDLK